MSTRPAAVAGIAATCLLGSVARADQTPQAPPVTQAWTDITLLDQTNNWSTVPGFLGRQGNQLITTVGVDPQTVLGGGDTTQVSLHANRTDPDTTEVPGVAEFELADPVVGLHATANADAPHLVATLNTLGTSYIRVAYDVVDLDASDDDSLSPLALHTRIGGAGIYTNIAAGFVADASVVDASGQRTHVDLLLPIGGYPLVELRWLTTNQVGQDEWIGIDDIAITVSPPPTGSGWSVPHPTVGGEEAYAVVDVVPGSNPASTEIVVRCDFTLLGLPDSVMLFDDGLHGDGAAGDLRFARGGVIGTNVPAGIHQVNCQVRDAENRVSDFIVLVDVASVCGDGKIEGDEACDDDGLVDGDGCTADCTIQPGWACTGEPSSCGDIDECATATDDCVDLAGCSNSTGSFACTCFLGYSGDGHAGGTGCTDVDECADGLDDCVALATCGNSPGGYTCACPDGYDGDGHSTSTGCVDRDECYDGTSGCAGEASCTNEAGGFTCVCNAGFEGDGFVCAAICGDGLVVGEEGCDDGGTTSGDGCDEVCMRDPGWTCIDQPSECIADADGDGVEDSLDNCPEYGNASQSDSDDDGIGDACDDDETAGGGGCGCRTGGGDAAGSLLLLLAAAVLISRRARASGT